MIGRDLGPLLTGAAEAVYGPEDAVGYELAGHAALFEGDYKIVFNRGPLGDDQWQLYNIVLDPGETEDLASTQPARFQDMLNAYGRYTRENQVYPIPAGYDHRKQLLINTLHAGARTPVLVTLLCLLLLLPFLAVSRIKKKGN